MASNPTSKASVQSGGFGPPNSLMRNQSFALTQEPILNQTKTVTRRMRWLHAKPGMEVQPVLKGMGLKPGESITKLGCPIRYTNIRRERLDRMLTDEDYGQAEVIAEGFPHLTPAEFVAMFCKTHKGCTPSEIITRQEFIYTVPHPGSPPLP